MKYKHVLYVTFLDPDKYPQIVEEPGGFDYWTNAEQQTYLDSVTPGWDEWTQKTLPNIPI